MLRSLLLLTLSFGLGATALHGQTPFFVNYGRGSVRHWLPSTYDDSTPIPLVMVLHGYSSSGLDIELDLELTTRVEAQEFLLVEPDGTMDFLGFRFWNATEACCDFYGSGVDDSSYLRDILDSLVADYAIDRTRIYCVGFSNGGFMTHRMGCDHADLLAGIANLSGSTDDDPSLCDPSSPLHYLQVHGTADIVISYTGGVLLGGPYPGAEDSVDAWALYNGVIGGPSFIESIDVSPFLPGSETDVEAYPLGTGGVTTEIWTVNGGDHSPHPRAPLNDQLFDHLFERTKVQSPFVRGDVNLDGTIDVSDPVGLLEILFLGAVGWPECSNPQDANDDDAVDISDVVWLLDYSFGGGAAPPAPFPDCGDDPDPSPTVLCLDYPCP